MILRKNPVLATLLFAFSLVLTPASAAIRYVNGAATGAATGLSWTHAYPELVTALNAAVAGDEIWLAKGTYRPDFDTSTQTHTANRSLRFVLKSDIAIYGGFSGTETSRSQRNWVVNRTILSGDIGTPGVSSDNTRTIMAPSGSGSVTNVIIEGITFVGGRADDPAELGGGIVGGSGGAVYLRGSAIFRHCAFLGNYAIYGGGIAVLSAQSTGLTVANCLFAGNSALYVGGAIEFQAYTGLCTVVQSTIINNSSSRGSAIGTNSAVTCVYSNNLIHSNPATSSGWKSVETGSSLTSSGNVSEIVIGPGSSDNLVAAQAALSAAPSAGTDGIWGTTDDIATAIPAITSPVLGAGKPTLVPADSTDLDGNGDLAESIPFDLARAPRLRTAVVDSGAFAFVNHPSTDITLSTGSVAENLPAGTSAGTFATIDPDGGTFTYTLVSGAGADNNALFTITNDALVTTALLDYESTPTLTVRVRSTDSLGAAFDRAISITVLDRVDPTQFDFSLARSQLGLSLVPSSNHLPVRVGLTPALTGFDFSGVQVTSDASWVTGMIDATTGELVLNFATAALLNSSYTATITVSNGGHTETLSITAGVSPLNLIALKDDPVRSRMYALHQNGSLQGSLVIIDPLTAQITGNISVGNKPADMAVSDDGSELLVLCSISKNIYAINLQSLTVKEVITLPSFDDWGSNIPSGHIAYGKPDIIYYVDGTWGPVMRVLKRSTRTVIQSIVANGAAPTNTTGFGDFELTSDKSTLYAWSQYGWSAGSANSSILRHSVNADGTLTYVGQNNASYPSFARDPLDTPVFISNDNGAVITKTMAVDANTITTTLRTFPSPAYALTPNAEVVSTATDLRELATGNVLYTLPVSSTVQAVTSDYSRLIYFNSTTHALGSVNLIQAIGEEILGRELSPAHNAIVVSPAALVWTPLPGVDRYRVYLGLTASAVASATTTSPEYLGEITGARFTLNQTLPPGTNYYWRVDAVTDQETSTGEIHAFTVSNLSINVPVISGSTVKGHANLILPATLGSASPGSAWTVSSPDSWVHFVEDTGTTPATLRVRLDASALASGPHQSSVLITSNGLTTTIPVKLQVDPLAVTMLRSRPGTTTVYAISEVIDGASASRAYLLELDALQKTINRVTMVGHGVTDLAVHEADQRVYVTNWDTGSLLAIGLDSLALQRTYAFDLPSAGNSDVYRISAAGAGRLVFEPEDQWVYIGILNTVTGSVSPTSSQREGGGASDPAGRYYYHGDNNSSGSELHKLDTVGNVFLEVTHNPFKGLEYYGSRTVVMSENGNRVFYNGAVYDTNLTVQWAIGAHIYSTTDDGRFAFGESFIYDTTSQQQVGAMPAVTKISAYNSATGRLVIQNGTALQFFSLAEAGLTGAGTTPDNNAVVYTPEVLSWPGMPAATGYRVYLGTSLAAVTSATPSSPEYLGQVAAPLMALEDPLAPNQTYYWRIDYVVGDAVAPGSVQSFKVVTISPSRTALDLGTVQGDTDYPISINLASAVNGETWSAAPSAPWIQITNTSGTTPATLQAVIDVSQLPAGLSEGGIVITHGSESYTVPVKMNIDPMAITMMQSVPGSDLIYAISEAPSSVGASRAYLLEINTATETVTRALRAGTGVTDLAVHSGDNRIYVTNWRIGALYAVGLTNFTVDRIYQVPPFSGVGYSTADVYAISAGGTGRLVVEGQDQWVSVSILNTVTGNRLATISQRQGGGAHDNTSRYYYHGDDNSSGATIHKFDTVGDTFNQLASIRVSSASYYGSRVVTVSSDSSRVFWNGTVFDANLASLWTFGQIVYSTTATGRFAFGENLIYDTVAMQTALGMPVTTKISAYSAKTDKLVVQTAQGLAYYPLNNGTVLPAPVLQSGTLTTSSVALSWTEKSLETSFTLQKRVTGTPDWTDVSSTLPQNSTGYTVTSLASNTSYEFRLKASATSVSSAWSNTVAAITPVIPLPVPGSFASSASTPDSTTLGWSISGSGYDTIVIERSADSSAWTEVASLTASARSYVDTGLQPETIYYYRIRTTVAGRTSGYSTVLTVTTPSIVQAAAPTVFSALPYSTGSIRVSWTAKPAASGHRLERQIDGQNNWVQIADVVTGVSAYIDNGLQTGVRYWYRIRAYNAYSVSDYSASVSAVAPIYASVLSDNFTGGIKINTWQSLTGSVAFNGGAGFNNSDVLWFGLTGTRQATTVPINVLGGGRITFKFRAGNSAVDGYYWDNTEPGKYVILEYSVDGFYWSSIQLLANYYPLASTWGSYSYDIPAAARSPYTAFRWRQVVPSGSYLDTWALDDVSIEAAVSVPTGPDFITVSTIADTRVAISWYGGLGAATYAVERSADGVNWTPLATTQATSPYYTDTSCMPATWYAYRIKTVNAAGTSAASSTAWARTYPQMDYWRLTNYGTTTPTGSAAPLARDFDSVTNLEKFGFGLTIGENARNHAIGTNQPGLPSISLDGATKRLRVEFLRRRPNTNPGVRYEVEFSDDLVTWTTGGVLLDQTQVDSLWERVRFEDSADSPNTRKQRFARVKLIQE